MFSPERVRSRLAEQPECLNLLKSRGSKGTSSGDSRLPELLSCGTHFYLWAAGNKGSSEAVVWWNHLGLVRLGCNRSNSTGNTLQSVPELAHSLIDVTHVKSTTSNTFNIQALQTCALKVKCLLLSHIPLAFWPCAAAPLKLTSIQQHTTGRNKDKIQQLPQYDSIYLLWVVLLFFLKAPKCLSWH